MHVLIAWCHLRNNDFFLLSTLAAQLQLKSARLADDVVGVLHSLLRAPDADRRLHQCYQLSHWRQMQTLAFGFYTIKKRLWSWILCQPAHHFRGCVRALYLLYFTFHSSTSLQCWQRPSWILAFAFCKTIVDIITGTLVCSHVTRHKRCRATG